MSLLEVESLAVDFHTRNGVVNAVKDVSFEVAAGEILAIVGESGSGKSVSTRAAMRLLPDHAQVRGSIRYQGRDVAELSPAELRALRGSEISMIFQDPGAALNPVRSIGSQLVEVLRVPGTMGRAAAHARALELLELVRIPQAKDRLRSYPHQLSGGQKQRVMIAMAMAHNPNLLLADEPTTALDVTVQAGILGLLKELRAEHGMAVVMITHNLGVVADIADRALVMRAGEIVEQAQVDALFANPQAQYTKQLLAAVPDFRTEAPAVVGVDDGGVQDAAQPSAGIDLKPRTKSGAPAVDLRGVDLAYGSVTAVQGATLQIYPGETLGLVGESGSGKTTLTRAIIGLQAPVAGLVEIDGHNPYAISRRGLRQLRSRIGMVFQDPRASLNPRMTVLECIEEPMVIHRLHSPSERERRARQMLDAVHLDGGFADRLPHELSGGQRQRVSIARALVLDPALLVADEATSALDVSVQAQVLRLLEELQQEFSFACLFVTHDLAVVSQLAHRLAVMRKGEIEEIGGIAQVLSSPSTDYARSLIDAVPIPDPQIQRSRTISSG